MRPSSPSWFCTKNAVTVQSSCAELPFLALTVADAQNLSATYDAQYIALAEQLGCEFWTDDRRLVRQVSATLPSVRWLGDFVG